MSYELRACSVINLTLFLEVHKKNKKAISIHLKIASLFYFFDYSLLTSHHSPFTISASLSNPHLISHNHHSSLL
jgi:hypothetical protein